MKRTKLILIVLIICTVPAMAEKMSLCKAFEKIAESSKNSFSDLSVASTGTSTLVKTYSSSIEIENAQKTEIKTISSTEFVVTYGTYASNDEGIAKIESIKKEFTACYSFFKFSNYYKDVFKSRFCNFIQNSDKGLRVYRATLKLEKWGDKYEVTFHFPAYEKATFRNGNKSVPTYTDYTLIDKAQLSDQFSKDLLKVVYSAWNGFENMKGGQIESSFYLFTNYASTFNISGYSACFIEDRTMSIINFVVPLLKEVDMETMKTQSQSIMSKVMDALGSNFAYSAAANGMSVTFTKKNSPERTALSINIESTKNNKYNMTMYIAADITK